MKLGKLFNRLSLAIAGLFIVASTVSVSACSSNESFTVTLVNENEDGGSLTGAGEYKAGSEVIVSYTANNGYKFDKWNIDGEVIKTSSKTYTFKMPNKDITITGNFVPKMYKVHLSISVFKAGELNGDGSYAYNSEVTVSCTVNPGFTFMGWYDDYEKSFALFLFGCGYGCGCALCTCILYRRFPQIQAYAGQTRTS